MKITDDQIEFIWQDVKARGITIENLVENLVDHICCLIEGYEDMNFKRAYERAINSFGKGGLNEIENNTKILLIFNREITMKKLTFILGYASTFIISFGAISRILSLVGGGLLMTFGIFILIFGFFPIFFYHQYRLSKSLMHVVGYFAFAISAAGGNILILHLPYNGDMIFTIGMILLNVVFLPWYCIKRYQKTLSSGTN